MTDKEKELQAEAIDYLRKRIAELESTVGTLRTFSNEQATCIENLEKENAELKERADKADLDSVLFFNQLCKAKEIIKKLYEVYYDPCVTESDLKYRDELFAEIKQFLKDSEVEK